MGVAVIGNDPFSATSMNSVWRRGLLQNAISVMARLAENDLQSKSNQFLSTSADE
jgi:hypothetical protein